MRSSPPNWFQVIGGAGLLAAWSVVVIQAAPPATADFCALRPEPSEVDSYSEVQLFQPRRSTRVVAVPERPRTTTAPDMVVRWNQVLLDAVRTDQTPPPMATRNMAIMHAAVYDAVNAIFRTHQVYRVTAQAPEGTSPDAAAAAAAYTVLAALYPAQQPAFARELTSNLQRLPAAGRDTGVQLGTAVAQQMLLLRRQDNAGNPGNYRPVGTPGRWSPTPPEHQPPMLPGWQSVTPFAVNVALLPRVPGPAPLGSAAYANAFEEVKSLGSRNSTTRTAEQTQIAHFWADGAGTSTPAGHWNLIAQGIATSRDNTLAENARLFALLNLSMADAAIICWWHKFTFDYWRPVTAIRFAQHDGNPATTPDPNWTPLLPTPPFPAYTSGHSSFSGAASAVLANFYGTDQVAFMTVSEGLPNVTRRFANFSSAAEEAGRSRIYGGIHWNFDNTDGLAGGRAVGNFVSGNYLLRR